MTDTTPLVIVMKYETPETALGADPSYCALARDDLEKILVCRLDRHGLPYLGGLPYFLNASEAKAWMLDHPEQPCQVDRSLAGEFGYLDDDFVMES